MTLPEFRLLRPRKLEEAIELLDRHRGEIQVLAGGTDVVPSLKQRLFSPRYLLDLKPLRELNYIRVAQPSGCASASAASAGNGDKHSLRTVPLGLQIGALATVARVARAPEIVEHFPVLAQAAHAIASPPLRNMGTLGGNLCLDTRCLWYNQSAFWRRSCGFCLKKDGDVCHVAPGGQRCWAVFSGDTAPALLVLGAEIEIASPRGTRCLPLAQFYTGDGAARMKLEPDEVLTCVRVPVESAGLRGAYLKFRLRNSIDYPLAGVAVALRLAPDGSCEWGRVAVTALNPAPLIVRGSEEALRGARLSDELLETLAQLASRTVKPLTTSASTPEYRREIARVMVKRAVRKAWEEQ